MEIIEIPGPRGSMRPEAILLVDPETGQPYAIAGPRTAKPLLTEVAVPADGNWEATNAGAFSVVVHGATSAGAGAASVDVEASHDATVPIHLGTVMLTLSTTVTSDGLGSVVPYRYVRARLTNISGTGAAVSATLGG